jgi:membrane fusion protein, multidrug efflux system
MKKINSAPGSAAAQSRSPSGNAAGSNGPRATTKTAVALGTLRRPLLALVTGLALTGCKPTTATPKAAGAPPPVPVQVAVARQLDVPRIIHSVGVVQALRTVAVKSQVDGMIAEIHFHEGDEVKAGDLLVTLDRRPFENSLRIVRADLANARAEAARAAADMERYQRLDQQEAISKEQFALLTTKAETTRALVQAKEAAVANAELLLGYTTIRAPIAGRTGQLILHEGALVKANDVNQSIVTLNQLAPIATAFSVPERALNDIRAALTRGDAAVTVVDQSAGVSRSDGRLSFFDNAVDPTTGTITLKAAFENADHALWPGQFVQVQTRIGLDRGALVVPSSAVQTGQDSTQIYIVKGDNTIDIRPVKVVRSAGDTTLLADGVRAGETVVTDGHLRLTPGARVEAKKLSSFTVEAAKPAAEPKS